MLKTARIVLGTVTATVLIILALFGGGILLLRSSEEYEVMASASSPDGAYTATFYEGAGGGAAGWYCATIVVTPSEKPFDLSHRKDFSQHEVFSGNATDLKLKWISSRTLDVSFLPTPILDTISVHAKRLSHDGKVIIQYSGALQQFAAPDGQ